MLIGKRLYNPHTGDDITEMVVQELIALARPDEPVILERAQAELARTAGTLAREFSGGHMIAQYDERVFDAWARQRGVQWFTKGDGVEYLGKHHPSTLVKYRPRAVTVRKTV